MKWHVYKKDDPNTWPQIDCPMVVYFAGSGGLSLDFYWDNEENYFVDDCGCLEVDECYYAYIGYVPSGYKASYPTKCACDKRCPHGFDDDGYCMSDRTFACEHKRDVIEYWVEKRAIWKEFDKNEN